MNISEAAKQAATNWMLQGVPDEYATDIEFAYASGYDAARAKLREELKEQKELWGLAADLLDSAGDPHVPFMDFHNPIGKIDAALEFLRQNRNKQQTDERKKE